MNRITTRFVLVGLLAAALLPIGCGGYRGASPAALRFAQAVYNVANRRAAEQVEPLRQKVAAASERGELSPREMGWLDAMLADAESGDWQSAATESFQMMKAQAG